MSMCVYTYNKTTRVYMQSCKYTYIIMKSTTTIAANDNDNCANGNEI